MAQIDIDKVKIVVEKNMRDAGLQGNYENGWKNTIQTTSGPITQQFNLQTLRDIISKSVVNVLQNNVETGTISNGNSTGVPVVQHISDDVVINSNPAGTSNRVFVNPSDAYIFAPTSLTEPKQAARKDDGTEINVSTDPVFITIYNAMIAALYTLDLSGAFRNVIDNEYGGLPSPADIHVSGVITGGSDSVRIGD